MTKCNRYYSVSILWLSQQCRDLWPSKTLSQFHWHYIQFLFSFYLLSFPCLPPFLFLNPKCWQGPALCSLPFYLSPSETASTCRTLTQIQCDWVPDNIFISNPNFVHLKLLSGDLQLNLYYYLKIKYNQHFPLKNLSNTRLSYLPH